MRAIENRESLLQDIADGLSKLEEGSRADLNCIEVVFLEDGVERFKGSLSTAIDYIVNDIYFDDQDDWSASNEAIVRTF